LIKAGLGAQEEKTQSSLSGRFFRKSSSVVLANVLIEKGIVMSIVVTHHESVSLFELRTILHRLARGSGTAFATPRRRSGWTAPFLFAPTSLRAGNRGNE
jgi:hypothetical protein